MPKAIPPPPPQPSESETQQAVRLVFILSAAFLGVFLALSACYHPNATMVEYGRSSATSWNVHRAQHINLDTLRAHEGGRIAWLVGSSILRESFDEAQINQLLENRESPWRVRKFGMTRGAAGVSSGILRHLPLQKGDLVIHSVAMGNFRQNWLAFNGVPAHRLMALMNAEDFWEIGEWTLADKLEQASAVPAHFYANHQDFMDGLTEWWSSALAGGPQKSKPGFHTTFHRFERIPRQKEGSENPNYFPAEAVDFSEAQFNQQGLKRMRRLAEAKGAELVLIDIPPQQQYTAEMIHPTAQSAWIDWRTQHRIDVWPQLPEADFYDLKHPNFRGRQTLSSYMVEWLHTRTLNQ